MPADFEGTNYASENKKTRAACHWFRRLCWLCHCDKGQVIRLLYCCWRVAPETGARQGHEPNTLVYILATSAVVSSSLVCRQCNVLHWSGRKFIHSRFLGLLLEGSSSSFKGICNAFLSLYRIDYPYERNIRQFSSG
jgi:hypothetical protein